MAVPLTVFARPFLVNPASRATLVVPVLVWEAGTSRPESEPTALTVAGAVGPRPTASDPLVLAITKRNQKLNAFALGVTVGRTENNDLVIGDASVSRFQGYFQQDARTGRWSFTDANSTNGSSVGPLRLAPSKPHLLNDHERLRLGQVDVHFLVPDAFFQFVEQRLQG